jgi:osmotically-inducible protein OsmY
MSTELKQYKNRLAAALVAGLALLLLAALVPGAALAANPPNTSDAGITLNVKLALLNKLGTDSLKINVDTNAGAVVLRGAVNKRETSELAGTVARAVANVKSVNNELTLATADSSTTKAVAAEAEAELKDALVETNVRIALLDRLNTDGFKVSTEVASGVVTLSFDKDLSAARRAEAVTAAKSVNGVTKVVNVDSKP